MAIPNRQIGWSNESNLLWNISSQLDRLTKVIANLSPGGGTNIYNSNGTLTGNRELSGAGNELKFKDVNQFYVQTSAFNTGQFAITDTEFKTIYNTNVIGLKLDFANNSYQFGQLTGGNTTYLSIEDTNEEIKTNSSWGNYGLLCDFADKDIYIGDYNDILDGTRILVNSNIGVINLRTGIGLTATNLTIDNSSTYPLQVNGTNVSSGTAGAASGQFLKIRVGGVDYKIALLNP